jgi:hypothetical protein
MLALQHSRACGFLEQKVGTFFKSQEVKGNVEMARSSMLDAGGETAMWT